MTHEGNALDRVRLEAAQVQADRDEREECAYSAALAQAWALIAGNEYAMGHRPGNTARADAAQRLAVRYALDATKKDNGGTCEDCAILEADGSTLTRPDPDMFHLCPNCDSELIVNGEERSHCGNCPWDSARPLARYLQTSTGWELAP